MVTENALLEHMAACESMYQIMLDDNRLLKATGAPPGDELLAQKRAVLGQLEDALARLRAQRDALGSLTPRQRAAIQKTQQIVLKALLLDRENEQLLLKCMTGRRPAMPQVRPTLDQIRRLYEKNGMGQEPEIASAY
jgi:hypothetical protein